VLAYERYRGDLWAIPFPCTFKLPRDFFAQSLQFRTYEFSPLLFCVVPFRRCHLSFVPHSPAFLFPRCFVPSSECIKHPESSSLVCSPHPIRGPYEISFTSSFLFLLVPVSIPFEAVNLLAFVIFKSFRAVRYLCVQFLFLF